MFELLEILKNMEIQDNVNGTPAIINTDMPVKKVSKQSNWNISPLLPVITEEDGEGVNIPVQNTFKNS